MGFIDWLCSWIEWSYKDSDREYYREANEIYKIHQLKELAKTNPKLAKDILTVMENKEV